MDKYIVSLLLLINIIYISTAAKTSPDGYYWRDFEGVIPIDALPVGFDENGRPIYTGQALVGNKQIPGKIYENDINVYYEWEEQAWSTHENIKILCTQHPESMKWILTSKYDVHELKNSVDLVKGGYQENFLTFIGRVYEEGKTNVGKVICRNYDCLALYVTENDDKDDREYSNFEILTYDPSNENSIKDMYLF